MGDTTENVLYVILHGLIGLVDIGDAGFNAFMFDIGTDHRYLYGTFKFENDIPERNVGQDPLIFTLDSVNAATKTGDNTLNPDLNVVIQLNGRTVPIDLPDVRAVIRLPRPRMIYYYSCGDAQNIIDGDRSKLVNGVFPSFISETRVFEYTFADSSKPQLLAGDPPAGDPLWRLPGVLAPVGNRNVAKLHFYDEPGEPFDDESVAEQHGRDEFALGTKRLGLPLTITEVSPRTLPEPLGGIQPGLDVLGIFPEETTPLDARIDGGNDGGGGGPICGTGNAQ
jgi:hypothetical protein